MNNNIYLILKFLSVQNLILLANFSKLTGKKTYLSILLFLTDSPTSVKLKGKLFFSKFRRKLEFKDRPHWFMIQIYKYQ